MSEIPENRGDLLNAIHSSRGMEHINRSHQRSFSLNIFRMNAQELIEITRRMNDPDEGMRLMAVANREAGSQTHREVTRRVHNFVAAALTLVEHTRIFMRKNYSDTPILDRYQARIDAEFKNEPLVQFVQNLRNYILHNGLPSSQMYLHFQSDPATPGSGSFETGIHIPTAPLLEWDNWSAPARKYIESSGEHIDIRTAAETYTAIVLPFHEWLQSELDKFHAADFDELWVLQDSMNQAEAAANAAPSVPTEATETSRDSATESEQDFVFVPDRAAALDTAAGVLLSKVRKIELEARRGDGFASERPAGPTITDEDMLSVPLFRGTDVSGKRVFVFIYKDGASFGFDEEVFDEMQVLTESVLKAVGWARRTLSRSFVEKTAIKWLQSSFGAAETGGLSEMIAKDGQDAVRPLELWAPIAQLEVQSSFSVGPAEIATVTKAMIDGLEAQAVESSPQQHDEIAGFFKKLRSNMQGFAAVVFKLDAESDKIEQDGAVIAGVIVSLLRFFSPAAVNFPAVCANALLGSELVPVSNLLVLGDGTFAYRQAMLVPNQPGWRISDGMLRNMRPGLDAVGALVRPEGLSAFALAVRSSLLLFSTGTTFPNAIERLTYTLSSLEALLLRHSAEPAEFNVAERMGFLLSQDRTEREEIARNVREAYRLRTRQDISPLLPREINSVATFLRRAHRVIGLALVNVDAFGTVGNFVDSVENLKNRNNVQS